MAPTNETQRPQALPTLPSYLYILIPVFVLISIAFIKRRKKSRFPPSGNTKHKVFAPKFSEKPITTDEENANSIAQCATRKTLPGRQAQQPESNVCISGDPSKMKSPEENATRSATLLDAQAQHWHQLPNHQPMLLAQQSPIPPELPRRNSGDSPGPLQMLPPTPHWQPEETACLADNMSKAHPHPHPHPHPLGSPVMHKQPVDFPQVQSEAVQFYPRAGPDKRQAWRRRILECN
ncbi:hypothetical protein BDDG_04719 [Blastomyces dermatitidis ATCC 18188]|uniref:Uncharacterized protein n=1 Tax=Ajellomyces dermatitidis (strain ATCC 18188 / CBS 674.68) TaxID=653446 RepID=F2TEZ1_AJEDA|nr:hypothetical protein BDDG_04719 [Blastomyces dermatitidis ATCC 18188]